VTTMPTFASAAETLASGAEGVRLALDAIGIGVITIGAAAALGGMVRARLHGERVRFTAVRLVLAQPSIGSQLVDNLNASSHVRAVLTDLFLLDEALKR